MRSPASWLRNLSIRRKLVLILMSTSATALLLASAGFALYEWPNLLSEIKRANDTDAQMLGPYTGPALAFEDGHGGRVEPETIRRYKLNLLGKRSVGV